MNTVSSSRDIGFALGVLVIYIFVEFPGLALLSSPRQSPGRAIVLPPGSAAGALAKC